MKAKELRELPIEELQRRHLDLREEFFKLKLQLVSKQLENYRRIGQVRRDIARILTVMKEKYPSGKIKEEKE